MRGEIITMLYYENQLNLGNIYQECYELFKEQKPKFLELLNEYIDIEQYIPYSFKKAFYADTGRPRGCSLYGYISALIFQKVFNVPTDTLLIIILNISSELRQFCGIQKVPDASKWTRFKQNFCDYIEEMFIHLVDVTEPICKAIDPFLANIDIYDISINDITKQYMDYLQKMEELNINVASSYLVMAAELMEIKSKSLLPHSSGDSNDEDTEISRENLINKLILYDRI